MATRALEVKCPQCGSKNTFGVPSNIVLDDVVLECGRCKTRITPGSNPTVNSQPRRKSQNRARTPPAAAPQPSAPAPAPVPRKAPSPPPQPRAAAVAPPQKASEQNVQGRCPKCQKNNMFKLPAEIDLEECDLECGACGTILPDVQVIRPDAVKAEQPPLVVGAAGSSAASAAATAAAAAAGKKPSAAPKQRQHEASRPQPPPHVQAPQTHVQTHGAVQARSTAHMVAQQQAAVASRSAVPSSQPPYGGASRAPVLPPPNPVAPPGSLSAGPQGSSYNMGDLPPQVLHASRERLLSLYRENITNSQTLHRNLRKLEKERTVAMRDFEKAKEALVTSESHREVEAKRYEQLAKRVKIIEEQASTKVNNKDRELKSLRKQNEVLRDNAMFEKSNQNKNETQLRASVKQQAQWINAKKKLERERLEAHAKLFEDHRKAKDDASHLRRELKAAKKLTDVAALRSKALTAELSVRDDKIQALEKQVMAADDEKAAAAALRRTVQRLELELKAERAGSALGPFDEHLAPLKTQIKEVSEENATLRIHNSQLSVSIQKLIEERTDLERKHHDALKKAAKGVAAVVRGKDDSPISGDDDNESSSSSARPGHGVPPKHVPLEKYEAKCREVADLNLRLKAIEEEMAKPLGDFSDEDSDMSDSELALDRVAGLAGVDYPMIGRDPNEPPASVLVAFKTKYPSASRSATRGGSAAARKQVSRSNSSKRARPRSAADDSKARKPNGAAAAAAGKKAPIAIDVDSDSNPPPPSAASPRGEDEDNKEADGSEMSLARRRKRRRTTVDKKPFVEESSSEDERSYSEDEDEDEDGADMEDDEDDEGNGAADDKANSDPDREQDDHCSVCRVDRGQLLCCDRCPKVFHLGCCRLEAVPSGNWLCPYCDRKKKTHSHKCSKCPMTFPLFTMLKRHNMLHRSAKDEYDMKGASKTCSSCDLRVANATLTCPRCRKRFVTPQDGKRNAPGSAGGGSGGRRKTIALSPPPAKKKRVASASPGGGGGSGAVGASPGSTEPPRRGLDGASGRKGSDAGTSAENMEIDTEKAASDTQSKGGVPLHSADESEDKKPADGASASNAVPKHAGQKLNGAATATNSESRPSSSGSGSGAASSTQGQSPPNPAAEGQRPADRERSNGAKPSGGADTLTNGAAAKASMPSGTKQASTDLSNGTSASATSAPDGKGAATPAAAAPSSSSGS